MQRLFGMVVLKTLKCKISDFLNSNTCFCSWLYGRYLIFFVRMWIQNFRPHCAFYHSAKTLGLTSKRWCFVSGIERQKKNLLLKKKLKTGREKSRRENFLIVLLLSRTFPVQKNSSRTSAFSARQAFFSTLFVSILIFFLSLA